MASDFPDADEDFDLLHEDEYEILREFEAEEQNPAPKIANVNVHQKSTQNTQVSNKENVNSSSSSNNITSNCIKDIQFPSTSKALFSQSNSSIDYTKKRSIDQVSQHVSSESFQPLDFNDLDNFDFAIPEKKKYRWDKPDELIKVILDKRKNNYNINGSSNNLQNSYVPKDLKLCITRRVPCYNFIAVTRSEDGDRFYIKVSERNKYEQKTYKPTRNFLIKSFSQLKDEAEGILVKQTQKASLPFVLENNQNLSTELWVDKYRPKRYIELLSDENVNRSLLYWLKLWDKIVFDRDPTVRARKTQTFSKFKSKFKQKEEDVPDYDSKGFPTQRIALLTGPPGLGKTTLAHVAARHAGYNIVELNASDDRSPEAFREALLSSTQMRALIDSEKRPNCLVLDEIDGAPSASIELLLKFIHGKLTPKGKSAKASKDNDGCRRPIICVCNDLYAPSLRPLRSMALVINVPEVSARNLTERLAEITRKEHIHVDARILTQLAERSCCDIRTCLGILQYTGGKAQMLRSLAFGLKDMKKGLFESWRDLLQVPMNRRGPLPEADRAKKIIQVVHQGEPDRLAQGIFHNYPELTKDKIYHVSKSMEWFEFYDEINTLVMERQSWMLMPYTTSAFVAWHLYLAASQVGKISYPTAAYEVHQKLERNMAVLSITKKACKKDVLTLVAEVLPYLPDLLCPKLRSVNAQLYTSTEKQELERLVNLMLDFGLSFSQEKRPDGAYEYCLDPNVWDIGTFPQCKVRKQLSYAVKQIVIQELEATRLQRAAILHGENQRNPEKPGASTVSNKSPGASRPAVQRTSPTNKHDMLIPNHLKQKLKPVEIAPESDKKCRNFFHAFQAAGKERFKQRQAIEKEQGVTYLADKLKAAEEREKEQKSFTDLFHGDIYFQYQEGSSNAIRRTITIEDLLKRN